MFKQIHGKHDKVFHIIIRDFFFLTVFVLISSTGQLFAQSGLHHSQHELDLWRQRKNEGPYKIIPSKSLTGVTVYEGGWEGLLRNKNHFLANPTQARWIVSPFPPLKTSNTPPLKASKRMCDAAFVALVENDVALANLVRDHLLWQAQELTTDFNNTTAWQRTYNHIGETEPNLMGSNWSLSHVYAYDFIKDIAEFTPEQKNSIHNWLQGMGMYYMTVARAALDLLFINPYNEDYNLSSYARSVYNNNPGVIKTHANGNVIQSLHKFYNNRRYSLIRCASMVGILLNNSFLKDRAARCFKEYFKFGMFPDGYVADYEKAFDGSGAPTDSNLGWKYSIVPLATLTEIADAFARTGDVSLFKYQTSQGALGSEGGTKSLYKGIVTFCKHVDGQTAFDDGATLHYQDGFLNDATRIINTNNAYNRDTRFTSFHDIVAAMANLFYKDNYVRGTYMRQNPGAPPFNTADVTVQIGGSDNIEIWGGGFDGMADMLFMYGQMESTYNPYTVVALSSPADQSIFTSDNNIIIEATATAPNTSISKVEFYNGATKLGESLSSPYTFTWPNPPAGNYTLTARAIDDMGAIAYSSSVEITVKLPNQAPNVSIHSPLSGTNFITPAVITIEATADDIDGTVSKVEFFEGTTLLGEDTDGSNGWTYNWTNATIGLYTLIAKVTDNEEKSATSGELSIRIKAPNQLPIVNAGDDQSINLSVNSISITGTASDSDGMIATYAWTKQSGPEVSMSGISSETLQINDLIPGAYVFRLTVTDNEDAISFDEVSILVNAAPAISITAPANNSAFIDPASVTITVNASDTDGEITKVEFYNGTTRLGEDVEAPYSYTWTNVGVNTYSITAKATDNRGAVTNSGAISILVNPAPVNQPPVANAGADITLTLPTNNVTLLGTAADPDGNTTIASTVWTKLSGPAATISGASTTSLTLTNLVEGTYVFRLTVSDNASPALTHFDEATVLVKPAPVSQSVASFSLINADTEQPIKTLVVGEQLNLATLSTKNLNIRANTNPASVGSVVFNLTGAQSKSFIDSGLPYALYGDVLGNYNAWTPVVGSYTLAATPYSASNGSGTKGTGMSISFSVVNIPPPCSASGKILREYWANISGTSLTAIPLTKTPTSTSQLSTFEAPSNVANNYGQRIRGYICAPATGSYTFYIASDDNSELYLSTDDNPVNKKRIASVTGNTNVKQWTKYSSQKSASVTLQAGRRYYIEALHKEGTGNDNLAVGWIRPGSSSIAVIPGSVLSPFINSVARIDISEGESARIAPTVYPNPFEEEITVNLEGNEDRKATITVLDVLGKVYYFNTISLSKGNNRIAIHLSSSKLKAGFYFLKIQTAIVEERVIKLIKK
ncbi:T9SS type A sorting domain-containing protein [Rhodocytophaga rosea]|uniref:T9SS type A sorting domain-containing protein n=1 Tax=Rhodocytophaga rosea TaxID=2704465 RepID=A0A6C0GIU7_9BACT|nr:Ig-like domain-containing protein [Rhodocytophaga rosea]QHT67859.1 T9SS type A sorting domain-containing protein [Rhodocytophaga rosea]